MRLWGAAESVARGQRFAVRERCGERAVQAPVWRGQLVVLVRATASVMSVQQQKNRPQRVGRRQAARVVTPATAL